MSKVEYSTGIGSFHLLGIVFMVLKLTDVIDWSWFWVTLPFWAGWGLIVGIIVFIFLIWLIAITLSWFTN